MSDAQYALSPSAAPPLSEADYDAIFAAVMETARGRWFLGEFAKRNRNTDSELVLAALDRVEAVWRQRDNSSPTERVKFDLLEMAKAIAQTKAEIAAITPEGEAKGTLLEATEELDSIVRTTEHATSTILAAAEHVQEIAWTLRERGTECEACDALDQRATDIYSACSFQDLTGQRTRKVVEVMRFLEERIEAMIDIWGATEAASPAAPVGHAPRIDDGGAEGHLDQPHIDEMMPGGAQRQTATAGNGHDVTGHDMAARPAATSDTDSRADDADIRDPDAHDAVAQDARVEEAGAREAVTQEAVTHAAAVEQAVAQQAPAQDAVAHDAVAQDAAAQDAVAQEAVAQDAVAQDAVPHAFPESDAPDAHADDDIHDAPASAVADRDSATASGEIPPGAERGVSPAPAASAAAMAPEPTEPAHEPEPEPLSVPALDELRNDPAALLSRILAIIHVPTEGASEEPVSAPGAVGSPVEADASPDAASEALSEIVAGSVDESAVMAAPPETEAKPAPMDVGIEPEADILPAPRPISVAEAVEEMLQKATARSAVPTRPGEAALAMMADPVPTAERALKAADVKKPAHAPQSFVMDVPGFAPDPVQVSVPPPVRPAHSERKASLPGAAALEQTAMDPVPDHALPEVALAGFGASRPEPRPTLPEVALAAPEPSRPPPSPTRTPPCPTSPSPSPPPPCPRSFRLGRRRPRRRALSRFRRCRRWPL